MILHTVNKNKDCLHSCIRILNDGDAILLIEDGVYAAISANEDVWKNIPASISLFALENDLLSRGLSEKLLPRFESISSTRFVDLTCTYKKVVSWG